MCVCVCVCVSGCSPYCWQTDFFIVDLVANCSCLPWHKGCAAGTHDFRLMENKENELSAGQRQRGGQKKKGAGMRRGAS